MPKYRKKPEVVEAEQFWNDKPWPKGVCDCASDLNHFGTPHMHLSEGIMDVREGDWIIMGTGGRIYPCSPDIFTEIYEEAN